MAIFQGVREQRMTPTALVKLRGVTKALVWALDVPIEISAAPETTHAFS
jgi:hypothetical protein